MGLNAKVRAFMRNKNDRELIYKYSLIGKENEELNQQIADRIYHYSQYKNVRVFKRFLEEALRIFYLNKWKKEGKDFSKNSNDASASNLTTGGELNENR